jgi:hypothetical protein
MFFFSGRMAEAGISAWRFLAGILLDRNISGIPVPQKMIAVSV